MFPDSHQNAFLFNEFGIQRSDVLLEYRIHFRIRLENIDDTVFFIRYLRIC